MPLKFSVVIALLILKSITSLAQTYIGGSINLGNFVVAEPFSKGIRKSIWPCGTATITRVNKIFRNTYINYGAGIGVLAYTFRIKLIDTLSSKKGRRDAIPQYSTMYLRANLSVWQKLNIDSKPHFIGLGVGLTLHPALAVRTSFTYEAEDNNQYYTVLKASLSNNIDKPLLRFFRVSFFKPVGERLLFGFEYTHHTLPILTGSYEFSHTKSPSFGKLSVYQREVSITTLVRISKR